MRFELRAGEIAGPTRQAARGVTRGQCKRSAEHVEAGAGSDAEVKDAQRHKAVWRTREKGVCNALCYASRAWRPVTKATRAMAGFACA
jgi:hypothetical protein